jgi:hypothetical protein
LLDWLFAIPLWLVILIISLPLVAVVTAFALGAAAAAGDRAWEEATSASSIRTRIDAIGDEADTLFREAS